MMKRIILLLAGLACASTATALVPKGDAEAGKAKAEQMCQSCHGPGGNSTTPQYPKLAGQHASYIARALHEYKSGARQNPIMAGMVAGLSDEDIDNLAAYFASQEGLYTPAKPKE